MYRLYPVFLLGLFIQGAGLTILQTASNPYVAILGPKESAARRISFMGICNGIAGVIAPLILGAVILSDADALQKKLNTLNASEKTLALNDLAGKVIVPYIIITLVLVALSILIYFSSLPEVDEEEAEPASVNSVLVEKTSIFQFPHLLLGVFVLFLYTGVEVIAGNSIIGYGAYYGIPLSTSKFFTAFTLVGMLLGYIIGIICIPRYFSQESALKGSAVFGVVCGIAAILTNGLTSVVFVAMLGLAEFADLAFHLAAGNRRSGKIHQDGFFPAGDGVSPALQYCRLLYGYVTDLSNPKLAYFIVIPCYLAIGYYAVSGHKIRRGVYKIISMILIADSGSTKTTWSLLAGKVEMAKIPNGRL